MFAGVGPRQRTQSQEGGREMARDSNASVTPSIFSPVPAMTVFRCILTLILHFDNVLWNSEQQENTPNYTGHEKYAY